MGGEDKKFKFDVVIGNPPYQDETIGDNKGYAPPIYHKFLDEAYKVGNIVEMIHPGRFLFNAGSTPKDWNKRMLEDKHLKVLYFEQSSSSVFENTDIKGGVTVTYRDNNKEFEPIGVFTPYLPLRTAMKKITAKADTFLNTIISGRGVYKLSDKALDEYPELVKIQSKGHKKDIGAGAFNKLSNLIFSLKGHEKEDGYVKFLGLLKGKRVYEWCKEEYVDGPDSFDKYKVFIPKANGSGAIGEVLSTPLVGEPLVGEPLVGATETFLSIGSFDTAVEAEGCLKYVKTKFARAMLGILKITQDNPRDKWAYVPLQDFTSNSDIDWTESIPEIDQQLYKKYDLSTEEIDFIESHVKEMN